MRFSASVNGSARSKISPPSERLRGPVMGTQLAAAGTQRRRASAIPFGNASGSRSVTTAGSRVFSAWRASLPNQPI